MSHKAFALDDESLKDIIRSEGMLFCFVNAAPPILNLGPIMSSSFIETGVFFDGMNKEEHSPQALDDIRWSRLMVKAQAGSEPDYKQLLSELGEVIQAYLYKRFGNQSFVEDCVQESLLAIHRARHTYDVNRPFRPWLFTIVRHKVIDYFRHKKVDHKLIERHQQQSDEHANLTETVEDGIDSSCLLNALSNQHREVLMLTKLVGLTCAETALQLGISESAVKVRVHRAISKLKQILEAEEK